MRFKLKLHNIQLPTALILLSVLHSAVSCPAQVQQLCHCVDEHDGVLLNCTQVDAYELVQVLRAAQAQIGLLKSLTIQDAKIPVLPDNFFAGLYIKRLELFHDGIQSIEAGAFNGLAQVLVELNLSGNKLASLPVTAVAPLHLLQRLDFSNNSIGELQSIDALPRLPKLFDINLSRNLISGMHKSFFDNVKNSLQTINLGHNQLTEIPASALRGFRQLMALHIHNNQLRSLASLSFMNLPILNLLNLASNRIVSIHRQAFLNVPQLRYLYMTDNHLGEVLPHQFASFEQLEMIDLSNNRIEQLGEDSFSNLVALRQLYLAENRISDISPKAFTNSSVVILILESNQLFEVTKDMFQGALKLQELSLKDNRIKSIDPNAFHNTPELVMIDLSHNELIDLAPSTFLPQLNMLLVDLSHNRLIRTPYSAFSRRVVTVLLQENPLVCTEKVHMLQQGVGVYMPNSEDKICGAQRAVDSAIRDGGVRPSATSGDPSTSAAAGGNSGSHGPLPPAVTAAAAEDANPFVQHPIAPSEPAQQHQLPIRPINIRPTVQDKTYPPTDFIRAPISSEPQPPMPERPFSEPPSDTSASHDQLITGEPQDASSSIDSESSTTTTTSSAESTTTGDGLDPNKIYPLPVPFLPKGPRQQATARFNGFTETLPPSIVIAPRPRPSVDGKEKTTESQSSSSSTTSEEETTQTSAENHWDKFELPTDNSVHEPRLAGPPEDGYELDDQRLARAKTTVPTAIIVVCLGTVAIVMLAVFVGMCVAKRRRVPLVGSSSTSSSTTARSNAYLSANSAAQLNAIYGTLPRGDTYARPTPSEDIYAWVCSPGMYNPYNK